MEDTAPYAVTMVVTPPPTPMRCLGALTVLAYTTAAGQQRYYKADEVEALLNEVLRTSPLPTTDQALRTIAQRHAGYLAGVTTDTEALEDYEYAVPALLGRLHTEQHEVAALRRYVDVFQQELLAHVELPESIQKVVYAHRQTLIVAKDESLLESKECNACGGLGCPSCHGGTSGKEHASA